MAKTTISEKEWAKSGFKDYVPQTLTSPYSLVPSYSSSNYITNRAGVSNDLKATMGIERISFNQLQVVPNEFGPNGETIHELISKDSRIRFLGNWSTLASSSGTIAYPGDPFTDTTNGFEVVFYGTGLNYLGRGLNTGIFSYVVDGGGTQTFTPTTTTILNGRNYKPNVVFNLVSGLTLGWHIVRIFGNAGNSSGGTFYGVEIIGPSSLTIPSGSAFSGLSKDSLSAAVVSSHTSSVTGTRGGRVIKYIKDGAISEVFQAVDASQQNLTAANHANEEAVRRINFREFGVNRADDFSSLTISVSNRAYTLDDGTTTLIGQQVRATSVPGGLETLNIDTGTSNFMTLTFVGTGLDIIAQTDNLTRAMSAVQVDGGSSLGTIQGVTDGTSQGPITVIKIVSGLPYGTHTVKFSGNASVQTFGIRDFIIYGPKKPTLPVGAIEIADYCVMADYVASTTSGVSTVAQGVLRKHTTREYSLSGSWGGPSLTATDYIGGFTVNNNIIGLYMEYSFFGTGFEFRGSASTGFSGNISVTIDGLAATTANFPSLVSSAHGGYSFSAGTFAQNGSNTNGSGISIRGLTLGHHKVRFTNNASNNIMMEAFDIITPIHSHDKGFLKVGSLALNDSRNLTPVPVNPTQGVDLSKAKAWLVYDKTNTKILASYNVSAVLNTTTGTYIVYFTRPFKNKNYVVVATSDSFQNLILSDSTWTPNSFMIQMSNSSGTQSDGTRNCLVCFGELENEETQ